MLTQQMEPPVEAVQSNVCKPLVQTVHRVEESNGTGCYEPEVDEVVKATMQMNFC